MTDLAKFKIQTIKLYFSLVTEDSTDELHQIRSNDSLICHCVRGYSTPPKEAAFRFLKI